MHSPMHDFPLSIFIGARGEQVSSFQFEQLHYGFSSVGVQSLGLAFAHQNSLEFFHS